MEGRRANQTGRRSQHHLLKKNVVKPGRGVRPRTADARHRLRTRPSAALLVGPGSGRGRLANRPHERTNASDDLSTVIPVLNQAIDGWVAAARQSGAGKAGDSGDGVAADDSVPCWPMAQLARRTVIPTPRPALACC